MCRCYNLLALFQRCCCCCCCCARSCLHLWHHQMRMAQCQSVEQHVIVMIIMMKIMWHHCFAPRISDEFVGFQRASLAPPSTVYKSSAVAEMGDRFATIDMGRNLGVVPFWGELGPHLTQCRLDRRRSGSSAPPAACSESDEPTSAYSTNSLLFMHSNVQKL